MTMLSKVCLQQSVCDLCWPQAPKNELTKTMSGLNWKRQLAFKCWNISLLLSVQVLVSWWGWKWGVEGGGGVALHTAPGLHTCNLYVAAAAVSVMCSFCSAWLLLLLLFQPHSPFSLTTAKMAAGPMDAMLSVTGGKKIRVAQCPRTHSPQR